MLRRDHINEPLFPQFRGPHQSIVLATAISDIISCNQRELTSCPEATDSPDDWSYEAESTDALRIVQTLMNVSNCLCNERTSE